MPNLYIGNVGSQHLLAAPKIWLKKNARLIKIYDIARNRYVCYPFYFFLIIRRRISIENEDSKLS